MGVLGKLMFWKKNDLGLGDELALPKGSPQQDELALNSPGLPTAPQMPQEPRIESFEGSRMHQPYQQPAYGYGASKDLELIAAKLDSLRATLDNINQRIANLERIAYGEDERRRGW